MKISVGLENIKSSRVCTPMEEITEKLGMGIILYNLYFNKNF